MAGESAISIALILPELLGTYGDSGNALVLVRRAQWRGVQAELIRVDTVSGVPASADIYVLGGGEDAAQTLAAAELQRSPVLLSAHEHGAVLFAVCAGMQILGNTYEDMTGANRPGLGVFDIDTRRSPSRFIGEVLCDALAPLALPPVTGYENHAGSTTLGPTARPFAAVRQGTGNADGRATEGVQLRRAIGTYLHGPVLARNPALADHLLQWVLGPLDPLEDQPDIDALRAQRLAAVTQRSRRRR